MYSHHKSLNFGQYVPNDKVLNKRVPENPKYKHVKPAVDTGKNVKRHIDELKEKQKNCNHKKDEVFNRVKFSTFIKLAISVAKEVCKQEEAGDCNTREVVESSNETNKEDKSKLANVIMGIGEIDLRNERKKSTIAQPRAEKKVPYLLLDVRDRDEFLRCHIKTAKHYPAAMLSRSVGYEIEEMKYYKNSRPELIILYDDDESVASRVATTLIQRGYDNIYILSGGLKLGYEIFPRALMASVTTGYTSAKLGPNSTVQIKTATSDYFSQEDIENIQQYMEDCPRKGNPIGSSKSYTSYSKSDRSGAYGSQSCGTAENSSKYGPATSRKDSACSSRSMDPVKTRASNRSATDGRSKLVRKAPWK